MKENKSDVSIINVFYGENPAYINDWIHAYIFREIIELGNKTAENVSYNIEDKNGKIYLIKTEEKVVKGYLYNKKKIVKTDVYSIKSVKFDGTSSTEATISSSLAESVEKNTQWKGINNEINHNVLKKCNKEGLYKIILALESGIKKKNIWNSTELIMMQNQITKDFTSQLYSEVVRQTKKRKYE